MDKETYQSLGIQGRRLENAFLPKKKPFVFVVDVDVMHESFRPGKALYERVLWCLGDDRVAPVDVNLVLDLEKEKDFRAIMRDSWKWTDCSIEERIHQMESTDHHALMDKLEIRWDDLLDEIRNSDNEKRKCIMEDLLNWIGMLAISRGKDRKSQKDIQSVWDSGLFSTESLSKHMQENATMSLSSQSLKGPLLSAQIQSVISSLQEQLQQVDSQGNPNDWAVLVGEFEKDLHHTDYFGQERRGWALILLPDSRYISIKYPSDSLQQSKLN